MFLVQNVFGPKNFGFKTKINFNRVTTLESCCDFCYYYYYWSIGHKNLTLKFDQNWVNNKSNIADVVGFIVSVLLLVLIQKPSFKFCKNQVIDM